MLHIISKHFYVSGRYVMKKMNISNGCKKFMLCYVIFLFALSIFYIPAMADDLYVFPNKGQDQEQIDNDKAACYRWARDQTGFDPMAQPTATAPPPPQQRPTANPGRGTLGGAAIGAAIGSMSGEAGKGAAIGAGSGMLLGGARRQEQIRQQEQANQQWAQQQAQIYQQQRSAYNRAYAACLEGKDYTVK